MRAEAYGDRIDSTGSGPARARGRWARCPGAKALKPQVLASWPCGGGSLVHVLCLAVAPQLSACEMHHQAGTVVSRLPLSITLNGGTTHPLLPLLQIILRVSSGGHKQALLQGTSREQMFWATGCEKLELQ